jgi:hypothetical protein
MIMAKRMLAGSRVTGTLNFRDEISADGGARHLRHSNRYAEERLWRAEAAEELADVEAPITREV